MKPGTKVSLGCAGALFGILALFMLHGWMSHEMTEKPTIPSPLNDAQASPVPKLLLGPHCQPQGDPPVSPQKLDEPGLFYTVTFTQGFMIANDTYDWRKFTMTCRILSGPSRDSMKSGKTERIVKPKGFTATPEVKITWPRAFKSSGLKEFHYLCDCTSKVVERPTNTFMMPFVPSE